MGIQNLLKFLKPLTRAAHISEWAGMTVGIDAMGWMHRGAIACAMELLRGEETDKFLRFIIHMIMLFKYHRVEPLLVFDGAKIPAKEAEDEKRRQLRVKAAEEARALLKKNEEARRRGQKPPVDERMGIWEAFNDRPCQRYETPEVIQPRNPVPERAKLIQAKALERAGEEVLTKCSQSVSISSDMVDSVIAACRLLDVPFLVAPYEADAQLAFLTRTGRIAAAVSEDSDLLAHGCLQVLFKLDKEGNCERLNLPLKDSKSDAAFDSSSAALPGPDVPDSLGQLGCLRGFTQEMFTAMCVLGGCDYTHDIHINGLGVHTACKLIHKLGTLERVLRYLCSDNKWKKKLTRPFEEILRGHRTAMVAFTHHRVFDVRTGSVVSACVGVEPRSAPGHWHLGKAVEGEPREGTVSLGKESSPRQQNASCTTDKENKPPDVFLRETTEDSLESRHYRQGGTKEEENTQRDWEEVTEKARKEHGEDRAAQEGGPLWDTKKVHSPLKQEESDSEAEIEKIVGLRQRDFQPIARGYLNPRTHQPRVGRLNRKERALIEEYRSRALQRVHQSHALAAARRYRDEQLKQEKATAQPPPASGAPEVEGPEGKTRGEDQEKTPPKTIEICRRLEAGGAGLTQASAALERFVASDCQTSSSRCALSQSLDTLCGATRSSQASSSSEETGENFGTGKKTAAGEIEEKVHLQTTAQFSCEDDGRASGERSRGESDSELAEGEEDAARKQKQTRAAPPATGSRERGEAEGAESLSCRLDAEATDAPGLSRMTEKRQRVRKEKEEESARLVLIRGQKRRGGQTKLGFLSTAKETRRAWLGQKRGGVQEQASEEKSSSSTAADACSSSEKVVVCLEEGQSRPNKKSKSMHCDEFAFFSFCGSAGGEATCPGKAPETRGVLSLSGAPDCEALPPAADESRAVSPSPSALLTPSPLPSAATLPSTCSSSPTSFSSLHPPGLSSAVGHPSPPVPSLSPVTCSDPPLLPSSSSTASCFGFASVLSSFAFCNKGNTTGGGSKRKPRKKFGEGFQAASASAVSWNLGSSAETSGRSRPQTPSAALAVAEKSSTLQKRAAA